MNRTFTTLESGIWKQSAVIVDVGGTLYEDSDFTLTSAGGTWSVAGVDSNGRTILNYDVPVFTAATSGVAGSTGLVPQPAAGDEGKYLRGDSTWQAVTTQENPIKCRAVSTSNIALSTATTSVDGVTLATGNKVLVTGQSTGSQNGVYVVPASGSWTRSSDTVDAGTYFAVSEGTVYKNSLWSVATDDPITVGTTALVIGIATYMSINHVGTNVYYTNGFALQAGSNVTITSSSTDGEGRRIFVLAAASGAPSGTNTQTLYYNGTTLTATSGVRCDGTYVGINASPSFGQYLTIGDAGSGEAFRASANSGTVARLFVSSGKGVHTTASGSGIPVYSIANTGTSGHFESTSGYGIYSYSVSSYGGQFRSRQHGAFYADQYGTLTANNNTPAFSVVRNLTLSGYTASAPLLWMRDITGSGGSFIELKDSSNATVFEVAPDGSVYTGTNVDIGGAYSSVITQFTPTAGNNNNIIIGDHSSIGFETGANTCTLTGIVAPALDRLLFIIVADTDNPLTIANMSGSSSSSNRISTGTGANVTGRRFVLQYHVGLQYWALCSYI